MAKERVSFKNVLLIASGMFAFFMGAGFASGQEILQYFVTYGIQFIVAVAAMAFFTVWTSVSFARAGHEHHFEATKDVYFYYGGKYLGPFFDFFIIVYSYGCYFYMAAAAATVANQTFGVPKIVGVAALSVLILFTVFFGFEGLSKVMGYSGVVNIILLLTVIVFTLSTNWQHIPDGMKLAVSGTTGIVRGGFTGNPLIEGPAYIGGTLLWYAIFLSELGARRPRRDSKVGTVLGSIFITGMIILSTLTMFSVLPEVAGVDIPNLVLANRITSVAGIFFTIVIIIEVYNTAAPQIWTLAKHISPDEKSMKFRVWTIVLIIIGDIVSLTVPYKTLVGFVLSVSGYVIFLFYGAVIVKDVRLWLARRNENLKKSSEISD